MGPQPDVLLRLQARLAEQYTIERELGRGAMATVYLARDLKHDRAVALKVLEPELAAVLGPERFLREVKVTAQLTHPHILPLHDSGNADGFLYYVMPYVEGESLRDRLQREKQLPLDDALQIAREVADALSYAHSRGVIHRDIKPENILLESGHAVVADFGIARAIDAAGGERLTETGVAIGTPSYMSPEQAGGSQDLDGRSDLYSLGCVLYEMLAGQPPFTGPTIESVIHQHLAAQPPNITSIRPSVPSWVVATLERALAKMPADRFNPVAQFSEAIAPRIAVGEPSLHRVSRPTLRRLLPAAGVALLAVGAAAGAFRFGLFTRAEPGPIGPRPYTIVAGFEGSAPLEVRKAARTQLSAVLDESNIVHSLPVERIRRGLELAGRPDTTWLDATLAGELAVRGGVRTVVNGTLDQVGRAFALSARVVDVTDSTVVFTGRERAAGEDELLDAVDRLARDLRRGLGERTEALQANRPAREVITPSFAAYLKYAEATQMTNVPANRALLTDAIRLDPEFAEAWVRLGLQYYVYRLYDSALTALEQAARFSERLTPQGVLRLRGIDALLRDDMPEMAAAYGELVDKYDEDHNNLGYALSHLGRQPQATEAYRSAARGPFPNPVALANLAEAVAKSGNFAAAHEVVNRMRDSGDRLWYRGELSLMERTWAQAESLALALARDPGEHWRDRITGAVRLATTYAVQGEVRRALRGLDSAAAAFAAQFPWQNWRVAGPALALRLAAGIAAQRTSPGCAPDGPEYMHTYCGFAAATAGDTTRARQHLAALARIDATDFKRLGSTPRLVEAGIAAASGRWDTVPPLLQSAVRWMWPERGTVDVGNVLRWFVAEAYERVGHADSAAAIYELLTSPQEILTGQNDWNVHMGMVLYSFAHFRLGRLYTQLGEYDAAKEHYATFLETFTKPDPEYAWMVTEARAKLAELARGR